MFLHNRHTIFNDVMQSQNFDILLRKTSFLYYNDLNNSFAVTEKERNTIRSLNTESYAIIVKKRRGVLNFFPGVYYINLSVNTF